MRNFWLLYGSQAASTCSDAFGTFVVSWMVYELTNSKEAMGGFWLSALLARLAAQFVLGPYLDRIPRKRVMLYSEFARLVAYGIVLGSVLLQRDSVWLLYGCAAVSSVVMYTPAANALVPSLVPHEQLIKANARINGIVQLLRFVAPFAAGICVTTLPNRVGVVMVVVMLMISMMLLSRIQEVQDKRASTSFVSQLRKGWSIYRLYPLLLVLGLFMAVTNFAVSATQTMYIPYVREVLGGSAWQYGLFAGAFPLGYIIGAWVVGRVKWRGGQVRWMLGALCYGGLTYVMLSLSRHFFVSMLIELSAGVAMPFWGVNSTTLYQQLVPRDIRAQVFAVRGLISMSAAPLGVLYSTFCVTHTNLPFLFLSVGLISCVVAGIGLLTLAPRARIGLQSLPPE